MKKINYPATRKPKTRPDGWVAPHKGRAKPVITKSCAVCSAAFEGKNSSKHCSLKCALAGRVTPVGDCLEWAGTYRNNGYGEIEFGYGETRKKYQAHRASWIAHHGQIPEGMLVCHRCDNPRCIKIEHLFLGTMQDNMDDRNAKKRHAHGERHGFAKLSEQSVREIRADKRSNVEVARDYGVHETRVSEIKHRKTWRHVE